MAADHGEIERSLRDREDAEHENRIVQHGEDGAEGQPPRMKAERDVREDQKQCEPECPHCAVPELIAHLRSDDVQLQHLYGRIDGLQGHLELRADRGRGFRRIGRQPDSDIARGSEVLYLRLMKAGGGELRPDLVDIRRARERRIRIHATREVDAEIQAPGEEGYERRDHQHGRKRVPHLACGHERVACLVTEKFHAGSP